MAPVPKKKFSIRKTPEDQTQTTDQKKANPYQLRQEKETSVPNLNKNEKESIDLNSEKYSKRSMKSNWDRYSEPVEDPHADRRRGNEFDVLLSYSGGTDSQLQLKDEKDWNELCADDKSITVDFLDLAAALKCLPLHKRLNLPTDIFDNYQVSKLASIAKRNTEQYFSKINQLPARSAKSEALKEGIDQISDRSESLKECPDLGLNIVESSDSEDDMYVNMLQPNLPCVEDKTESLIDSLTSCLSIKDKICDNQSFKENPCSQLDVSKSANPTNDLDFLLSLSLNTKAKVPDKTNSDTNVDDWLNSILDD